MFTITGKYGNCKVYCDESIIDNKAIEEVKNMMNNDLLENCEICLMPDLSYAGKNSVVGYVQTTHNKINPEIISGDIGCGISVFKTNIKYSNLNLEKLDKNIRENINPDINNNTKDIIFNIDETLLNKIGTSNIKLKSQLCTLGRGNHFIELLKDRENYIYIAVHSGSRNFGQKILKWFTKDFNKEFFNKEEFNKELTHLKNTLTDKSNLSSIITELKKKYTTINKNYLEGDLLQEYKTLMYYACQYASYNRKSIAFIIRYLLEEIVNKEVIFLDKYESIHNYLGMDNIIRKGAISSYKNERIVIGLNMAEGLIIAEGKGNDKWLNSAPHGLGRMFSRNEAKKTLNMDDFINDMKNIYSNSKTIEFIDESPSAYKNSTMVLKDIDETCEIIEILKPILNIKY